MIGDEMGEKVVSVGFHFIGQLTTSALMKAIKDALLSPHVQNRTKDTVGNLMKSGQQISGYEVRKDEIKGFDRYAKLYHFKYSLIKERNDPEHYFFSFYTKDIDKLEAANRDWIKDKVHDHADLTERIEEARTKAYTINKAQQQVHEKQHSKGMKKDRGVER